MIKCYNANRMTEWRFRELLSKEPCTIRWIEKMQKGDIFWDIGANIGLLSLYAACVKGVHAIAFEPEAHNFSLLNDNILLNDQQERVTAYPFALSNRSGPSLLHMADPTPGGSCHSAGEKLSYLLEPRSFPFSQGTILTRGDFLVSSGALPFPSYIKIDVDGLEHRVVEGLEGLLQDKRLQGLCIEVNSRLEAHLQMVEKLAQTGWIFDSLQVEGATRTEGPFRGVAERIFFREVIEPFTKL